MTIADIRTCATEYAITCAECGWTTVDHQHRKEFAAETFREDGWSIGRQNICPDCVVKKRGISDE